MNRIRELRKQKKITQKELAKHLSVSDSTLSYWEMGKYDPDNEALLKLSKFFHVPIDYILSGVFNKWDMDADRVSYRGTDTQHLSGNGTYVSEYSTAYNQSPFARIEFEGLTPEETDLIAEYAMFLKSRRKAGT